MLIIDVLTLNLITSMSKKVTEADLKDIMRIAIENVIDHFREEYNVPDDSEFEILVDPDDQEAANIQPCNTDDNDEPIYMDSTQELSQVESV